MSWFAPSLLKITLLISPSSFSSKVCPIYFLWRKITQTLELVWFKSTTTPPSPSGWGLSYNFTNEYLKELILEIRITKSRMSIFAPINGYVSCSVSSNALGNVNTETLIDFLEQEMQLKWKKDRTTNWTNFVCKAASSKQFYYLRFTSKYTEREQRERSMFS